MPSLCQNISSYYAHLRSLTEAFTITYAQVRDSGDLREVRRLKTQLEEARMALFEQLMVFVVPDATNPYHEALLEAGLDPKKTAEQQDTIIDIRLEIRRQLMLYSQEKDLNHQPVLQAWLDDINENIGLIYTAVAIDRTKIESRIKEGMIPIIMPSRSVQIRTWKSSLIGLTPVWINKAKQEILEDIYSSTALSEEIMKPSRCFEHIPDRPYVVWAKPSQRADPHTCNMSFSMQKTYYSKLATDFPELYDRTDIIPTEYMALQCISTFTTRERYKVLMGKTSKPVKIKPLDYRTYTRFLSIDVGGGEDVSVCFQSDFYQLSFLVHPSEQGEIHGFRPASRS